MLLLVTITLMVYACARPVGLVTPKSSSSCSNGGLVTTLAGSVYGFSDGTGTGAKFSDPWGIAVDSTGNLYVADYSNNRIRKITPGGLVTTLAGSGSRGSANGTGTSASFNYPSAVAVDAANNVYVADTDNCLIRKINPAGVVTTLSGSAGVTACVNGPISSALFAQPQGITLDSAGNVYVADAFSVIRKITVGGIVSTVAGSPFVYGYADGTGSSASFTGPSGLAVDATGTIYVADTWNCLIRKITSGGIVTTLAGSAQNIGSADGTGTSAFFNYPSGVAIDSCGNIIVADGWNNEIRKITPGGVVTTLVNWTAFGFSWPESPNAGYMLGGIAIDSAGVYYVTELMNTLVYKVN
jgi:sugar lactone lactonase YvrE